MTNQPVALRAIEIAISCDSHIHPFFQAERKTPRNRRASTKRGSSKTAATTVKII